MRISTGNCEQISLKIPAFIDGELSDIESKSVKEHIKSCNKCRMAYDRYSVQNELLKEITKITPSDSFNSKLFQKIEQFNIKRQHPADVFFRWILPLPALCAVVLVVFMGFTLVSPYLYALPGQNETSGVLPINTKKSLISFIEFSSYCDNHCRQVCRYCRVTKGSKCSCGGCADESEK